MAQRTFSNIKGFCGLDTANRTSQSGAIYPYYAPSDGYIHIFGSITNGVSVSINSTHWGYYHPNNIKIVETFLPVLSGDRIGMTFETASDADTVSLTFYPLKA